MCIHCHQRWGPGYSYFGPTNTRTVWMCAQNRYMQENKHPSDEHSNKSTQNSTDTQSTHINNMGKTKGTILAIYNAITRPILKYFSTIWSALASDTNINKIQITRNTALRIAIGCITDSNTQHLHAETHILPIK